MATRIRAKSSAKSRLASDISAAAGVIAQVGGSSDAPGLAPADRNALDEALVECAGVPQIVDAVSWSTRRRAAQRTGWPVVRWLRRLRKDPLHDLGLGDDLSMSSLARAAVPEAGNVQRANAELAIRDAAEKASIGLERPWRDAIRDASNPPGDDIIDALDRAIHETSLGVSRPAIWWRIVQALQLLLILGMVGGLGWLAAQGIQQLASFDLPDLGKVGGVPMAAIVAGGSLVGGLLLAAISSLASQIGGRRKAKRADRQLREAIDRVIAERIISPIQAELDAYGAYRSGILDALS
jgi:hypothetical protein